MPEYLAPGVYIEEIERGPQIITPVATSTAAFLGETERGRTRPTLVTNWNEYVRHFGGVYAPDRYLPYAVRGFFENGGRRCYIARIVNGGTAASRTQDGITVRANGPGAVGNNIRVRIGPSTTLRRSTTPGQGGQALGFRLQVFFYGTNETIPNTNEFPTTVEQNQPPPMDRFPQQMPLLPHEDFDDLVIDDPSSPNFWDKRLRSSAFVNVQVAPDATLPTAVQVFELQQGENGPDPTLASFQGESANVDQRQGLAALELDPYRDVSIIYAPSGPGVTDATIAAIISHCENNRFRFAVIDSDQNQADSGSASLQPRNRNDTSYAAFYYPWIFITDPRTNRRLKVPPGGYVCGIYARTDNTRGVYKAPANEPVRGALELEYDIDQRTQEVLNPRGVNAIRRFADRGIRVWGARTLSSNPLWRYVNVRRLLIFLEASIYNSTQWVVFEPNNQQLWARVRQTVILFLRTQWREGALLGRREEEAFSVAVGLGETMTDDDVNSGRLIIEVGVRPTYPAEFVIFRVFQITQSQTRS